MTTVAEAFVTLRPDLAGFGRETEAGLQSLAPRMRSTGMALMRSVTLPLMAVGGAASLAFKTIDDGLATVARRTGATGEVLQGLQGDFRAIGRSGPDSFSAVGDAVAGLNRDLGVSGAALQDAARAALDTSRVMGADLNGVINQGATLLRRYGRETSDFSLLMDQLTVASQQSGVSVDRLIGSLRTYSPVLRNAGFELEETIAFMAAFEGAGLDISRIMPGLNAAMRRWAQDGITDLSGELARSIGLIEDATSQAQALGIATDIFGAEGAQRLTLAIRSGLLDLNDFVAVLGDAEGAVARTAAESRTFGEDLAQLRNRVGVALEPIGRQLAGGFRAAIPLIEGVVGAFTALPAPVQASVVALAALAAAAGPVLVLGGAMVSGFLTLAPAIGAVTSAVLGLNIALLANPVTAGLVVGGLVAGAVAAKIFGDAMGRANDEMERANRIAQQTEEETRYILDGLEERERWIRAEIDALRERAPWADSAIARNTEEAKRLRDLERQLKDVTLERQAQTSALKEHERQERESAEATEAMAQQIEELTRGLQRVTPQTIAASAALKVLEETANAIAYGRAGGRAVAPSVVGRIREIIAQARSDAEAAALELRNIAGIESIILRGIDEIEDGIGRTTSAGAAFGGTVRGAAEAGETALAGLADQAERTADAFRSAAMRDIDAIGRGLVTALQRQQEAIRDAALGAIQRQRDAYMDMHNDRLRLIERERDAALGAIDDQIAALTQASRDDRLADLERALLLAWDPRERQRIEQQITEHMRQEDVARLRNERSTLEDGFRAREDAARRDLDAQMAAYDRQEREARDTYERMTAAWELESRARELVMAGEMDTITGLLGEHLEEWPGLWQSMSDAVVNGPLRDLRGAVAGVLGGMGALGAGGSSGAGGAVGAALARAQAEGHRMVAGGAPPWAVEAQRAAVRGAGGIPSFDLGGVVPGPRGVPRLAMVHGGETVLPTHRGPVEVGPSAPTVIELHNHMHYPSGEVETTVERLAVREGQVARYEGGAR